MILIADSGSTKTDWSIVEKGRVFQQIFTKGINPFYQSETDIKFEIEQHLLPQMKSVDIEKIFFYGAGCSFPDKKAIVSNALGNSFPDTLIEVQSDLLGAARALLQNQTGIACILGTGSNSCFYNGVEITNNVSPLGFILGDEGSGAVLSKSFMADCLKNQISEPVRELFFSKYKLTPAIVLDNVYKQPFPNRYLAQFTPFLSENISQAEIYNVVYNGFISFFERNIKQYDYQLVETSFIGSVAHYFKPILTEAAQKCGVKIGKILKSPMSGLIEFHTEA